MTQIAVQHLQPGDNIVLASSVITQVDWREPRQDHLTYLTLRTSVPRTIRLPYGLERINGTMLLGPNGVLVEADIRQRSRDLPLSTNYNEFLRELDQFEEMEDDYDDDDDF